MAYDVGDTLVRVILKTKSGLVADYVVNDFAFIHEGALPTDSEYQDLQNAVDKFYNHSGGINPVSEYMGPYIDRSQTHEMEFYQIKTPPLGSPKFVNDWVGPGTSVTGTTDLPAEVAGCISFKADYSGAVEESGTTRPRARRRGRIYVGTLATNAVAVTSNKCLLSNNFCQAMRESMVAMAAAAATAGFTLSVWSRADAQLRTAIGGWTDNAPDTQRRRGPLSSARVTYSL